MLHHRLFIIFSLWLVNVTAPAQDFVYQPTNPAFGGSYLNYNWMLSSAQAQNDFQEEGDSSRGRFERDPLDDFEESLNRQLLSQLSRNLYQDQFGEGGLEEGQYELGNYLIDVAPTGEGIQITILDTGTGSETTVSVPYF
ncbi:curli production assembly/transport component CsgF [Tunicatimonas pelagia]|uniref:curli production assembly/transport component CsgF n=1 Tax=Tunicatimonas pelagia TaxID=931531 RepID=UPI002666F8FE|nr:curli production assembly/transport component CsgF [Tunicatimonas pelagia]WKN42131.1 curli assembly protein CsgF [Tunicatimonas pelagia]